MSVSRASDALNVLNVCGVCHVTTHPTDPKRGRVDFNTFLKNWTPEILYKGRDTLDAFLWEGLMIRNLKPHLNNKNEVTGEQLNGFTDFF